MCDDFFSVKIWSKWIPTMPKMSHSSLQLPIYSLWLCMFSFMKQNIIHKRNSTQSRFIKQLTITSSSLWSKMWSSFLLVANINLTWVNCPKKLAMYLKVLSIPQEIITNMIYFNVFYQKRSKHKYAFRYFCYVLWNPMKVLYIDQKKSHPYIKEDSLASNANK